MSGCDGPVMPVGASHRTARPHPYAWTTNGEDGPPAGRSPARLLAGRLYGRVADAGIAAGYGRAVADPLRRPCRRAMIRPLSSTSRARPRPVTIRPILTAPRRSVQVTRMPCNGATGVIVRLIRRISSDRHARRFRGRSGRGGQGTQSDAGGGGGVSRPAACRTVRRTVWNGTVPIGSSDSASRWASMSMPFNPHPPIPRRA